MSSISAGTTSTTTLVHSGDTTGSLVFKTNDTGSGGTTAVTIDTSQNTTFAGKVTSAGALTLASNGTTTAVTIDTSGNVGLGTTTPARKLHVRQGGVTTLANTNGSLFTDAGNAGVLLGSDNVLGYISGVTAAGTATVDLVLQPFGGSVMAGTTNPTPAGSGDTKGISLWTNGSSSQIFSTGNGDTAAVFNRAGSDGALIRTRRQGSDVGSISVTASATAYNTSSDYRLKENIAPMTGALARVAQLKPVTYKWKVDGSDGEGFIAHELAEVCPQAVHGEKDAVDENGKIVPQGIDTSFLAGLYAAAFQELIAEVNTLKAEIAILKAK